MRVARVATNVVNARVENRVGNKDTRVVRAEIALKCTALHKVVATICTSATRLLCRAEHFGMWDNRAPLCGSTPGFTRISRYAGDFRSFTIQAGRLYKFCSPGQCEKFETYDIRGFNESSIQICSGLQISRVPEFPLLIQIHRFS